MTNLPEEDLKKPSSEVNQTTPLLPPPSTISAGPQSSELHGYLYMATSCIGFSSSAILIRIAEDRYRIPETSAIFIRATVQTVLSSLFILCCLPLRETVSRLTQKQWQLLVFRGLAGAMGIIAFFKALQILPVGDAITLFFCSPVLTMILSRIVLGEPITLLDGIAAVTSFVGVVVVARPDYGGAEGVVLPRDRIFGSLLAVAGAFLASIAYVAVRSLGTSIHFMLSVFSLGLALFVSSVVLGGALGPIGFMAKKEGAFAMLASSLFAFSGQCYLNKGLQLCRAGPGLLVRNLDVPIVYVLGMFFLGESPSILRLAGSVLVLSGAVMIGLRQMIRS